MQQTMGKERGSIIAEMVKENPDLGILLVKESIRILWLGRRLFDQNRARESLNGNHETIGRVVAAAHNMEYHRTQQEAGKVNRTLYP